MAGSPSLWTTFIDESGVQGAGMEEAAEKYGGDGAQFIAATAAIDQSVATREKGQRERGGWEKEASRCGGGSRATLFAEGH
ncbi:hypothetical protein K0M31_014287 [Melipona bicolor]|uniref:Uncharacterized protein n=1 Tax=Melipona bicolor TaxID=60889 RepID=A0AA40G8A6_9HYME|nr:hypothetical protein K0M31_014287 [Melipona bicolor]